MSLMGEIGLRKIVVANHRKIIAKLEKHAKRFGFWDPMYVISAEVAAAAIDMAVRLEDEAIAEGVSPTEVNGFSEVRQVAREMLVDWYVIPREHLLICPVDQYGRDLDLKRFLNEKE